MPLDCKTDQSQYLESEKHHLHSGTQKVSFIRTVALLNTWSNELMKKICSFREVFDWYGRQKKDDISVLVILHK